MLCLVLLGFYLVLPYLTKFDSCLLSFTEFYLVVLGFSWVLRVFFSFTWFLFSFTNFYRVFFSFTGFYGVLPHFQWLNKCFMVCSAFGLISMGFYLVLLCFAKFCLVILCFTEVLQS